VADLLLLDALARQALGRERVFRDRVDILEETDEWLTPRFRLPRTVLLQICSLLEPQLQRETRRSNPIPPHVQVLTTAFLAKRNLSEGDWRQIGCVPVLCESEQYTAHIRIKAPSPDAFPFLNHKQYHSINVQITSDSKYNRLNVVARWPGGAHNYFVLQNSSCSWRMEMAVLLVSDLSDC